VKKGKKTKEIDDDAKQEKNKGIKNMAANSEGILLSGIARKLVNDGLLSEAVAKEAIADANKDNMPLLSHLVQKNLVNPLQVATSCSKAFNLPLFDLSQFDLARVDSSLINEELCIKHRFIPILRRENRLFIAVSDPTQTKLLEQIKFQLKLNASPIIVEENKLAKSLEDLSQSTTYNKLGDIEEEKLFSTDDENELANEDNISDIDIDDTPVVRFVNKMILSAISKGASDIHFEPYEKNYRVRFRLDGILSEAASPPIKLAQRFASRLKVMSRLDLSERRLPQDGRFKLNLGNARSVDFRISSCPTLFGEKIVLRILDSNNSTLDFEKLGITEKNKETLLTAIHRPQGMVLVTGPTGSGKTVTLYTCLNILNSPDKNILTVEDPVEINLAGINQVHVNNKAGLTFASALRSFLRQDPDIIMVGEIRDLETAEIAIKSAQTGHMVFSTLHTNSAAETLTRLVNMGVPSFNIATSVSLIVAQRLARRLCTRCKKRIEIPQSALLKVGFKEEEILKAEFFDAVGCDECNNGYKGRIGIYEMLPVTEDIGSLIMNNGNAIEITQAAEAGGFISLRQAGLQIALAGITSLEEIERVTID
jgi:type IV pilus assembly protein PilB